MRAFWIGTATAMLLGGASAQQTFAFQDLLARMVEPPWLRRPPVVGERSAGVERRLRAAVQRHAIVQCSLAGQTLGVPFGGYAERVSSSGPRDLGVVELPAGDVDLRLQILGRNGKAKASHMVGLDSLRLELM